MLASQREAVLAVDSWKVEDEDEKAINKGLEKIK